MINKTITHSWKIIQVVQHDVDLWSKIKTFEYAERTPGVRIIITDPKWYICITKERRHELNNWVWSRDYRLPWGKVFNKLAKYNSFRKSWWDITQAGLEAVQEEAREEVGIDVIDTNLIHISACGATMRRDLYYYHVSKFVAREWWQELWDGEDIHIYWKTPSEVIDMCLGGQIWEDRSVAVLLRFIKGT